jgi:hypothetical protein
MNATILPSGRDVFCIGTLLVRHAIERILNHCRYDSLYDLSAVHKLKPIQYLFAINP